MPQPATSTATTPSVPISCSKPRYFSRKTTRLSRKIGTLGRGIASAALVAGLRGRNEQYFLRCLTDCAQPGRRRHRIVRNARRSGGCALIRNTRISEGGAAGDTLPGKGRRRPVRPDASGHREAGRPVAERGGLQRPPATDRRRQHRDWRRACRQGGPRRPGSTERIVMRGKGRREHRRRAIRIFMVSCETEILREADELDLGKLAVPLRAAIRRTVVDNDDLQPVSRPSEGFQRFQTSAKECGAIVGNHHRGDEGGAGFSGEDCWQASSQ